MKKNILVFVVLLFAGHSLHAGEVKAEAGKQFMQITTVESVVSGGFGRSKMLITNPDGTQTESDMENLFSLVGINFKNIKENEDKVVKTIKLYADDSWKIESVTSFTLSPSNNGPGIFMTRYLMSKPVSGK